MAPRGWRGRAQLDTGQSWGSVGLRAIWGMELESTAQGKGGDVGFRVYMGDYGARTGDPGYWEIAQGVLTH